jgi:hypothetical protein
MATVDSWREQLARALDWEDAHVGFDKALSNIPPDKRGSRAAGLPHSPWQLLEHLRLAVRDLVDFAVNPHYAHTMKWPDDYWPADENPSAQQWEASLAAFRTDLEGLQAIARDATIDLFAPVPSGKPRQTQLRNLILALDHNAYHVGQIVAVRQALGIWP